MTVSVHPDRVGRPRPCPARKAGRNRVETDVGFIYVAKFVDCPEVKIGFALSVDRRMRELNTRHRPMTLLASVPGRVQQERALHRTLAEYRGPRAGPGWSEYYPLSILSHPAIPEGLRDSSQIFLAAAVTKKDSSCDGPVTITGATP